MTETSTTTPAQILSGMATAMGEVPAAIAKATTSDPRMLMEQVRSSAFSMPGENPALDDQTRTLIYLAVALATSNSACTRAMINKARVQNIPLRKAARSFSYCPLRNGNTGSGKCRSRI